LISAFSRASRGESNPLRLKKDRKDNDSRKAAKHAKFGEVSFRTG
jgi:hypothetical protein